MTTKVDITSHASSTTGLMHPNLVLLVPKASTDKRHKSMQDFKRLLIDYQDFLKDLPISDTLREAMLLSFHDMIINAD